MKVLQHEFLVTALITFHLSSCWAFSSQWGSGRPFATNREEHRTAPIAQAVSIGKDMHLEILIPPVSKNRQISSGDVGTSIRTSDGRGDVVWPSSFALANLVSNCPFLVDGKRVLELGCGLGLPSLAALLFAHPSHVALSDRDTSMLSLAYKSSTQLNRCRASVSRSTMDWTDEATWPKQDFDILIGSDILYEAGSILSLVKVLKTYLQSDDDGVPKRAILVDPVDQVNRPAFRYAAFEAGLDVEEEAFPGMKDFVLLKIT